MLGFIENKQNGSSFHKGVFMCIEREPAHMVLLKELFECLRNCQKGLGMCNLEGLDRRHRNVILAQGICRILLAMVIPEKDLAGVKEKLLGYIKTLLDGGYEGDPENICDATDALLYEELKKTADDCDAEDRKPDEKS